MSARRGTRIRRLTVFLLVAALGTVACGAAPSDSADQPSSADPNGTITVAYDLIANVRGGFTWDPAKSPATVTDDSLFYLVYGRLLRPTQDDKTVPDQASSATAVDPTTIELKLRAGQTFSDGTPFDAAAVQAGLERSLNSGNTKGFTASFFDLKGVTAVDAATVRLSVPNGTAASWLDTYLGSWETSIVKPDATDPTKLVGAGPMKVADFVPEQSAHLVKNPSYWDAASIKYGGLDLVAVNANDHQAAVNALAAGQVQMAPIDVNLIPNIGAGNKTLTIENSNRLMAFQICKTAGPLANPDVRRAINKALDRKAINDAVFNGIYRVSNGLWPGDSRFHDPSIDAATSYDPAAAKQLLAGAGYAGGFTLDAYVLQSAGMPDVAQVAQQQLAQVGITMKIILAPNYLQDFLIAQKPGMGMVPTVSPDRRKLDQWSSASIENTCRYDDPGLDQLRDKLATVSETSDEAVQLWHQIEQKVVAQDALSVFVLFSANLVAYDPKAVGNVAVLPTVTQLYVPDPRATFAAAS